MDSQASPSPGEAIQLKRVTPVVAGDEPRTTKKESEQELLEALLARVGRRDEAAFEAFYDATASRVYARAYAISRDARGAEDVVADVYLQAWRQAPRHDAARGCALAWLLTICRSRALDYLRRRDGAESHPAPERLHAEHNRDDNEPLQLLLALERNRFVYAALATLGEKEQQIVGLAFFQGLSHREIAMHTGIPLGSVKTMLRRAARMLRARLAPAMPAPNERHGE